MSSAAEHLRVALFDRLDRLDELATPDLRVLDLPLVVNGSDVLLGRDDEGVRLFIPLEFGNERWFREDRRSAGVHLRLRTIELGDALRWYLDLVCVQARLRDVFVSLLVDVLGRLDAAENPPEKDVRRCFAEWRSLFASGDQVLSVRQQAGLFGELTVLLRCLERDRTAARLWCGPLQTPHDFEGETLAVEVKTTLANDGTMIRVNGLGQLEAPADGELLLAHVRVDESADGLSIVDVAARASELDAAGVVAARLHAAGYRAAHEAAYRRTAFLVSETSWYSVDDRFPRIVASSFIDSVPAGVGDVDYSVDILAAGDSAVDDDVTEAFLLRLVSGA